MEDLLSGRLAWLFKGYHGRGPFLQRVRKACEPGYTGPDRRAELGGMDVAGTLVILAREAGLALSLEDVSVHSVMLASQTHVDRETFMQHLDILNASLAARHAERLDADGRARVRLVELPADHPFAHAWRSDNIVPFRTRRYAEDPLHIQGPVAGPEVTAAGGFIDQLRLATGART